MKRIVIYGVTALSAVACGRGGDFDATGTFEATEVVVSAEAAGRIYSFDAEEGDVVSAGSPIGTIDTVQLYLQKLQLERQRASVRSNRPDISKQASALREQIAKNREYYAKLERQRSLLLQDLDYGRRTLERDSLLLAEAVISAADYETTAQNYLSKQNTKAGFDATLTSTELQIIQSEQQLVELTLQQENETAEYERTLEQSRQQLAAQIAQWRQQYVLEAPVAGRVTLVNYWSENQHVAVGDKLASIVPDGATEVIGRLQVPSAGFGKVKVGQGVNVKLNGYPYMEFGVLRGRIRSLSAVPEQIQTQSGTTIAYTAEVVFPDGMTTSYKRELPMIQRMDGTAEIVTEDMRLIERFIQPVVSLFKNR